MYKSSIYIKNFCVHTKIKIRTKRNDPLPSSTVFLIDEKLLSLWLWTFQIFIWILLTFCQKLSVIAWVYYFVLQICWKWVEKKTFFDFMDFNPLQTKLKWNIPIINVKTKVILQEGHWNSQKAEKQRKNRTKVFNLTKTNKSEVNY